MTNFRERLLGGPQRLGWWTLPVFLIVGLAGAVLAGTLTVVYYSQQVSDLESRTADVRGEADAAAEDIRQIREDALAEMEQQVETVRGLLTQDLPVSDAPTELGVVVVRAVRIRQTTSPAPSGSPSPGDGNAAEPGDQTPATQTVVEKVGTGFAVARSDRTTFFVTTFELVADPASPGGVREQVEIRTSAGTFPGVVHSWDEGRDLALVRADVGEVPIPEWRPEDSPLVTGDRVLVIGVTPTLNTVHVGGSVGFVDSALLVTDLEAIDFLRGAPIVDSTGQIVGVFSLAYRPFGDQAGDRQASVPIRLLCERMLQNCDGQGSGGAGGSGDADG